MSKQALEAAKRAFDQEQDELEAQTLELWRKHVNSIKLTKSLKIDPAIITEEQESLLNDDAIELRTASMTSSIREKLIDKYGQLLMESDDAHRIDKIRERGAVPPPILSGDEEEWHVHDGMHRLAILAHDGVTNFPAYFLTGIRTVKGGPGSGHHGHAGRPGQVGGSVSGKGGGGIEWWEGMSVTIIGGLGGGISTTQMGELDDGTLVVHKEQHALTAEMVGSSAMAEQATHEVAEEFLGFEGTVPKAVALDDKTSIQEFLTEGTVGLEFDLSTQRIDEASFKRVAILDAVVGNQDRHLGNVWFMPDGKVKAIDNDHAFTSFGVSGTGILNRTGDTYMRLTGRLLNWEAKDFAFTRRLMRSNSGFEEYVTTKFGPENWRATRGRLDDLRGFMASLSGSGRIR